MSVPQQLSNLRNRVTENQSVSWRDVVELIDLLLGDVPAEQTPPVDVTTHNDPAPRVIDVTFNDEVEDTLADGVIADVIKPTDISPD